MYDHADQKFVQNDWSTDPDNPAVIVDQLIAPRRPANRARIPNDIRRQVHENVRQNSALNTWLHSMGISRVEHELHLIELARKAVERANAS